MTIGSVIAQDFVSITPDDSLVSVLDRMRDGRLSCVPVVEGGLPVGVISERDILCLLAKKLNGESFPATARGLMSGPPITIHAHASVDAAVRLQHRRRIRRLLVVDDDGRLVGILTQSDLVDAQTQALRADRDQLEVYVCERTEELRLANERLEHMSMVDPMLGTGNRRAMDQHLARLQGLSEQFGRGFAVLMLDIDNFKSFNDHYGHPEADAALGDMVSAVQGAIRPCDVLFRFGGEEFVVTLPETDEDGAVETAERIRGAVEALQIPHELSSHAVMTVSLGVHVIGPETGRVDISSVIRAADASLYDAKENGRNKTGKAVSSENAFSD
jgi:diguanylate cyclase (GGDEF)-like protein